MLSYCKNDIYISNFLYTHNINFLIIQIPNFQHSIYFTTRNKSDAVFHLRASGFSHKPNQTSVFFVTAHSFLDLDLLQE